MSSAALLRKKMLTILQRQILPDLQSNDAPLLMMAHLPLHVPAGIRVRELPNPPLKEEDAEKIYPDGKKWTSLGMHAIQYPSLYCVVEGEADLSMGITSSMIRNAAVKSTFIDQPGGYIFSLFAPAYLLVPQNVPQRTLPPWSRENPHIGKMTLFVIRILPVGALCTISEMEEDIYTVQYSLLVKDDKLASVIEILISELKEASVDWEIIKAQLLTLMLRLKRGLNKEVPLMTDGLYSRFPENEAHPLHHPVIERVHQYIQLHLHEPLTPAAIAAEVQVTPDHLNRILKTHAGISTMNYVIRLRMEAAQLLLRTSDLSVQEISQLVGYRQLPHFSRTFHRHSGQTPLRYRQQKEPFAE